MEAIFLKLANMSITASWIVFAIIILRFVFHKMPKWMLCLLWALVGLRLICPFSLESALSLIPSAEPLPQEIIYTAHPQIRSGIAMIDSTINPVLESSMTPVPLGTSANPTQIWSFIISQIWFLGMVIMVLYASVSYLVLKNKVKTAIPMEKGIRQSEYVVSPFVLGFINPIIYLPFGMELQDAVYVISHEKAHIRRKDHWWKPLGFLLLSIYWFNPVLWIAYILLCRDIEAACDERVIRDMEKDELRSYSTALLNCSVHRRSIAACPLAFGETGVKTRIKWIMNYRKPAFWVVLVALVLSVIVAVCFLTDPKDEAEKVTGIEEIENIPAHNVVTWFNKIEQEVGDVDYMDQSIQLGGMENVTLFYNSASNRLRVIMPDETRVLFSDIVVWNLFLSDLNGDGVHEICATTRTDYLDCVYIVDLANDQTYELKSDHVYFYRLVNREDTLFMLQYNMYWNIVNFGQPVLKNGTIEMAPLQECHRHLTESVSCVDINNRKMVCLSDRDDIERIIKILDDIRAEQTPISITEWEAVYEESYWYADTIEINYELGQQVLHFSGDYSFYWNETENAAYQVADNTALKAFMAEATNGVLNREVSGKAFADMDTPWDWCNNMTSGAVKTAKLEAKYHVTPSSVTGTSGVMSQKTLEQFVEILHSVPKSAFTAYETDQKQSFRDFVNGPQGLSSGISILDGVNSLAVGFSYHDGQVRMVLTEETDQFDQGNFRYMTRYRLWNVDDARLTEYIQDLVKSTPVITYTVGAEYNWQEPLSVDYEGFRLELNLMEGWIYEYVTDADSYGIRIRPEGEGAGWLYFSFWPEGYHPVETDRYLNEGMWYGFPSYTSYPSSVKTPTSFSTYHQVWSYRRIEMENGDFAIINDGADSWFLQYEDQIDDIDSLSRYQADS